jgi:hypothetical protein
MKKENVRVSGSAWLWLAGVLWACTLSPALPPPSVQEGPKQPEVSKQEQALRARIAEFYYLLQQGAWVQAEAYVTEDTREFFSGQSRNTLLGSNPSVGFKIDSVKLDPDGQGATAVVTLQVFTKFSPTPLPMPRTSSWRLVKGAWYLAAPKPDSKAPDSLFEAKDSRPPASEELKFKGHRFGFGIVQPGQIKTARFPFTNVTTHVVKLAAVLTSCDCLKVKTAKKEYKPGESGELVIEFDPTGYTEFYDQTIVVKTDPGDLRTDLAVDGYVALRPRETPKTEEESKPAKKP